MAWAIGRVQTTWVGHRLNFWGRATSYRTQAWDYRGREWSVERPADSEPPRRCSVACVECGKELTYVVHSLDATRRRRAHRWMAAIACLVTAIPICGLATLNPNNVVVLSLAIGGGTLALVLGFSLLLVAGREIGIAGHGSGMPV